MNEAQYLHLTICTVTNIQLWYKELNSVRNWRPQAQQPGLQWAVEESSDELKKSNTHFWMNTYWKKYEFHLHNFLCNCPDLLKSESIWCQRDSLQPSQWRRYQSYWKTALYNTRSSQQCAMVVRPKVLSEVSFVVWDQFYPLRGVHSSGWSYC